MTSSVVPLCIVALSAAWEGCADLGSASTNAMRKHLPVQTFQTLCFNRPTWNLAQIMQIRETGDLCDLIPRPYLISPFNVGARPGHGEDFARVYVLVKRGRHELKLGH